MHIKHLIFTVSLNLMLVLSGCSSSSSDSNSDLGLSTSYPYLLSAPQVSFAQNATVTSEYDVTITLSANGPTGVQLVDLWVFSKDDDTIFKHLDLQFIGGTTWTVTTNPFLSLPAGNYYIDSMMLQDADPFDDGLVRSSWYSQSLLSGTHYDADQQLTNWDPLNFEIVEFNFATSVMPVVNFTLP